MTVSNVKPIYPAGIFPWTDRIDNQSVDFANDINSTVAEVESIENTIGTSPLTQTVPVGIPVNYSTVSSRITDAMVNAQMPYCTLLLSNSVVSNNVTSQIVQYQASLDPYNMFNGTDITIPANGWWYITSRELWGWWNDGYVHQMLALNGASRIMDEQLIDWAFSGNVTPTTGGPTPPQPLWWTRGRRGLRTVVSFEGALHAGDRISVYNENGTSNPSINVTNLMLKAYMSRTIPPSVTFVSG